MLLLSSQVNTFWLLCRRHLLTWPAETPPLLLTLRTTRLQTFEAMLSRPLPCTQPASLKSSCWTPTTFQSLTRPCSLTAQNTNNMEACSGEQILTPKSMQSCYNLHTGQQHEILASKHMTPVMYWRRTSAEIYFARILQVLHSCLFSRLHKPNPILATIV